MADQPERAAADAANLSLAGAQRRRAGERVPGSMRRIGLRHAVVTVAVTAQVVDRNSLVIELDQTVAQLARARQLVAQLEAQRSQLETKLAQFDAAPIERLDGDPDVPLEEPKPEPKPELELAPLGEASPTPAPTPAPRRRG
jgi:hypothetical protein